MKINPLLAIQSLVIAPLLIALMFFFGVFSSANAETQCAQDQNNIHVINTLGEVTGKFTFDSAEAALGGLNACLAAVTALTCAESRTVHIAKGANIENAGIWFPMRDSYVLLENKNPLIMTSSKEDCEQMLTVHACRAVFEFRSSQK